MHARGSMNWIVSPFAPLEGKVDRMHSFDLVDPQHEKIVIGRN